MQFGAGLCLVYVTFWTVLISMVWGSIEFLELHWILLSLVWHVRNGIRNKGLTSRWDTLQNPFTLSTCFSFLLLPITKKNVKYWIIHNQLAIILFPKQTVSRQIVLYDAGLFVPHSWAKSPPRVERSGIHRQSSSNRVYPGRIRSSRITSLSRCRELGVL